MSGGLDAAGCGSGRSRSGRACSFGRGLVLGAGLVAVVAVTAACTATAEVDGAGGSVVAADDAGGAADGARAADDAEAADDAGAADAAGGTVDGAGAAEDAGGAADGAGGSVVAADGAGAADDAGAEDAGGAADGAGGSVVAADGAEAVDGGGAGDGAGDAAELPEVEVEGCGVCLLTGLRARVDSEGVSLTWTVDEARAGRITGFVCSYRTPGHRRLGVWGAVGCSEGLDSPGVRSTVVSGLPEFGDYDFEVSAKVDDGPAIDWGERALRLRVAVTEDVTGPAGPGLAVSGEGPVVTGCGPDDGPGVAAPQRPWQLDRIVSDTHLTHYPGRGWSAGGDAATPPDWPEMVPMGELLAEAGLDGDAVDRVADAGSEEQQAAAAAMLADERGAAVVAHISARSKALLRPGPDPAGGWELRLHSGYPFGADYVYGPDHAAPGWDDPAHAVAWPALWVRTDCPPPSEPHATHDVALAVADDAAGGARLEHSGYGWWAVEPVGLLAERIVATKGGLSFGGPAAVADAPASWRGRASGHLFWDRQRYALAGDVTLTLERSGGAARLAGRIDNVVVSPLDHDSLEPLPGPPLPWRTLTLDPAAALAAADATADPATAADPAAADAAGESAWAGAVRVDAAAPDGSPAAAAAADAFEGDWQAAAYGPAAGEVAGRLRLWIPLADGADPQTWPAQAVLVAGFGAKRTS